MKLSDRFWEAFVPIGFLLRALFTILMFAAHVDLQAKPFNHCFHSLSKFAKFSFEQVQNIPAMRCMGKRLFSGHGASSSHDIRVSYGDFRSPSIHNGIFVNPDNSGNGLVLSQLAMIFFKRIMPQESLNNPHVTYNFAIEAVRLAVQFYMGNNEDEQLQILQLHKLKSKMSHSPLITVHTNEAISAISATRNDFGEPLRTVGSVYQAYMPGKFLLYDDIGLLNARRAKEPAIHLPDPNYKLLVPKVELFVIGAFPWQRAISPDDAFRQSPEAYTQAMDIIPFLTRIHGVASEFVNIDENNITPTLVDEGLIYHPYYFSILMRQPKDFDPDF